HFLPAQHDAVIAILHQRREFRQLNGNIDADAHFPLPPANGGIRPSPEGERKAFCRKSGKPRSGGRLPLRRSRRRRQNPIGVMRRKGACGGPEWSAASRVHTNRAFRAASSLSRTAVSLMKPAASYRSEA